MYEDQFGEFVCGYWGLKGEVVRLTQVVNVIHFSETK